MTVPSLPEPLTLLEWECILEEAHQISERCLERLLDLRTRFPDSWADLPDQPTPQGTEVPSPSCGKDAVLKGQIQ